MREPAMQNLFLIGYRGTGKTTVAQQLAAELGWKCVDGDERLETEFGRNIAEIFADEGEAGFRTKESAILNSICQQSQQVVATGGGIILRAENRRLLRDTGKTVWLTADIDTIWRRMQQDATTLDRRPNLTTGGIVEIEDLLARRQPLYEECADWKINTVGRSVMEVVAEILGLISANELT